MGSIFYALVNGYYLGAWGDYGSCVADATYGQYVMVTIDGDYSPKNPLFTRGAFGKYSNFSSRIGLCMPLQCNETDMRKMDDYYKTLERIAPQMGNETYWRMLIERTKKEPSYRSLEGGLDVFRAMEAAKVNLKPQDRFEMAEAARNRGIAIEAANSWAVLVKAGDSNATKNKALVDSVTKAAAADKATELAKSEALAATRATGEQLGIVAEGYLANGNTAKAIELFNKALAKGQMPEGTTDLVKLRLGIAQFKAGKKADAVKTWQAIKADNGAGWLAKTWIAISKA